MKTLLMTALVIGAAAAGCAPYSPGYPPTNSHPAAGHSDGSDPYRRPANPYRLDGHSGHAH